LTVGGHHLRGAQDPGYSYATMQIRLHCAWQLLTERKDK